MSVILPIRNEGAHVERALTAVQAQDYPPDRLECLVVDGQSTDDTVASVKRLRDRFGGRLQLLENPGRIVPTGLNIGLRAASGDVIVRVDGHCEIAPDFVRRSVAHLVLDNVACVGGVLDTIGETWTARVIATAMRSSFGVGGSAFRAGVALSTLSDTVAFPAFARDTVDGAGPFDEELVRNQDDEYSYRLRQLGGRVLLATDIRARYYSRGTIRGLWRQYLQYGYWKVRVMQQHPRQMRARQFVPALLVVGLVFGPVAALAGAPGTTAWLPASTYLAGAAGASIVVARQHGWRLLPGLPFAFAAMHLSYGLGFLTGLVAFRDRWRRQPVTNNTNSGASAAETFHARRSVLPPGHH